MGLDRLFYAQFLKEKSNHMKSQCIFILKSKAKFQFLVGYAERSTEIFRQWTTM